MKWYDPHRRPWPTRAWAISTSVGYVLNVGVSFTRMATEDPLGGWGPFLAIEGLISSLALTPVALLVSAAAGYPAIALIRAFDWPRPVADVVMGIIVSGVGLSTISMLPVGPLAQYGLDTRYASIAGACAGFVYWLLARRPRPPYVGERSPT